MGNTVIPDRLVHDTDFWTSTVPTEPESVQFTSPRSSFGGNFSNNVLRRIIGGFSELETAQQRVLPLTPDEWDDVQETFTDALGALIVILNSEDPNWFPIRPEVKAWLFDLIYSILPLKKQMNVSSSTDQRDRFPWFDPEQSMFWLRYSKLFRDGSRSLQMIPHTIRGETRYIPFITRSANSGEAHANNRRIG